MATATDPRLLLDASVLLSDRGLEWLEEEPDPGALAVVSETFVQMLERAEPYELSWFLRGRDQDLVERNRSRLLAQIHRIPTTAVRDNQLANPAAEVVLERLLENDWKSQVRADEWSYLESHSWMASLNRRAVAAFRDAGAVIIEFEKRLLDRAIAGMVAPERVPALLTPGFVGKVVFKWVIAGSAVSIATVFFPPTSGLVGLGAVPVLQVFDP